MRGETLGRTLRSWRARFLAHFTIGRANNGGTEADEPAHRKDRRLGHGLRNFTHYRLRILLAANGTRTYLRVATHA